MRTAAAAVYEEANWGMEKATTISENVQMIIFCLHFFFEIIMNKNGIEWCLCASSLLNESQTNKRYEKMDRRM